MRVPLPSPGAGFWAVSGLLAGWLSLLGAAGRLVGQVVVATGILPADSGNRRVEVCFLRHASFLLMTSAVWGAAITPVVTQTSHERQ